VASNVNPDDKSLIELDDSHFQSLATRQGMRNFIAKSYFAREQIGGVDLWRVREGCLFATGIVVARASPAVFLNRIA
jgi:hypothetical protein